MSRKQKKRLVGLIILLIVFGLLVWGFVWIKGVREVYDDITESTAEETVQASDSSDATDDTPAAVNGKVTSIDADNLVKLSYTVDGISFEFTKADAQAEWIAVDNEKLPIRQSTIESITSGFSSLLVNKVIEETLDNKENYGLNEPEVTVSLTDANDNNFTIYLGIVTLSSSYYRYAYVEGENRVITVSATPISYLVTQLNSLVDYSAFPEVTSGNLTRIEYSDTNQDIVLINEPEDLSIADAIGTTVWYYKQYDRYMATNYDEINEFLSVVSGITYSGIAEFEPEDLDKFGLNTPQARLSLTSIVDEEGNTETYTLLIGNIVDEDADTLQYYVTLEGDKNVYTAQASAIEYFTKKNLRDYLMSTLFAMCNFDGIESIDIVYGDKTLNITVTQGKGTDEDGNEITTYDCKLNGESYDEADTRTLFANIIRVYADHILADEDVIPMDEVLFKCTYHTNYEDLPEITYEISAYDSVYYEASVNGNIKYAVAKQEYKTLLSNLEDFWQ